MTQSVFDFHRLQSQLQAHLETRFGQPCDLTLLAHGEANLIFRLGADRLVRVAVNTPNQRFNGDFGRLTKFEQRILTYLKGTEIGHELQAAQIQPADDFAYTYLITNYLTGCSLDYSTSHLQRCAETLAHLHRLPHLGYAIDPLKAELPLVSQPLSLFYQESQAYAQPYLTSAEAEPEIVSMLQSLLAKTASRLVAEQDLLEHPHLCLVHGDHSYDNWVINPQRAYLIDWEWAELGSPAGDLGHFLSPVTIIRRQGYALPEADRIAFLEQYYAALENPALAETIRHHFAAFGPFPAVRSLCWTAGYWVTANRWYADLPDSEDAARRLQRFRDSREQFPPLWQAVMDWLEAK